MTLVIENRYQALARFSFFYILNWRIEFSFLKMFSIVKILKNQFSFSSRNSRFWRKFLFLFSIEWDFANRFSSRESKFWEKKLIFFSWLFPQFLFQFYILYSNFSQQKHVSDSILQNTIFILELDVRTPLSRHEKFEISTSRSPLE